MARFGPGPPADHAAQPGPRGPGRLDCVQPKHDRHAGGGRLAGAIRSFDRRRPGRAGDLRPGSGARAGSRKPRCHQRPRRRPQKRRFIAPPRRDNAGGRSAPGLPDLHHQPVASPRLRAGRLDPPHARRARRRHHAAGGPDLHHRSAARHHHDRNHPPGAARRGRRHDAARDDGPHRDGQPHASPDPRQPHVSVAARPGDGAVARQREPILRLAENHTPVGADAAALGARQ